jgi:hypothetical protein
VAPRPPRITIMRPKRSTWITVHPDSAYSCVVTIFEHTTATQGSVTFLVAGKALQREMIEDYGAGSFSFRPGVV